MHADKVFDMIDYFFKIYTGILQHQDGNPVPIYERVQHCRKFLESSNDAFFEDVSYKLLKEHVYKVFSKVYVPLYVPPQDVYPPDMRIHFTIRVVPQTKPAHRGLPAAELRRCTAH